jgi:hypothetical protein
LGRRPATIIALLARVCGKASIDVRRLSHHYAAVMNYAVVMKKHCFA